MRKNLSIFLMVVMCFFTALTATAQNRISGKVTNAATGEGISGVTVTVKGTRTSVQTDANGTFSIVAPANARLVISSIGYATQDVAAGSAVNINLVQSAERLEDVVVVAYGSVKKKDLTGSVSTVTSKDFQKGSITTPEQLIAGKVAGVSVVSNGGAPGSGSTIRIRGGASLNASNDPLIVIDGVPLNNDGIAGAPNPLSLINPNDIETFTILKDASATALYGSRASNGVILITTKKGRSGKPKFNFNTQLSAAVVGNTVDVLSADEFRAYVNANGTTAQKALLGTANTNWQDEIYQTAISTDNNISVSGALSKLPYRLSLGYLNQNGILRTGNLARTSVGLNLSPKLLNNNLSVDLNMKGSMTDSRYASQGAIGSAGVFDPSQPVRTNSNRYGGYFEYQDPNAQNGLRALSPRNPVALLEQTQDNGQARRFIGNVVLDYKLPFLTGLRANLNVGLDAARGEGTVVINDSAASGYKRYKDPVTNTFHGGTNNQYRQDKTNKLLEFYLGYGKDLNFAKSNIDLIAGYGYQDFSTTNYFFNDVTFDGTVASTPKFPFEKPDYTILSYFGRLNYSIADKYLLTASVRTDGSSRFAPGNRWSVFPAAAFAWKLKEESFMKNSKTFSDLKLRLSYGETGQQDGIGLYDYVPFYFLSNDQAQYQLGNTFYNLYRPDGYYAPRKWEQTATSNIGLDYGFVNNRITGSIDAYYKKTTDLLNLIDQSALTNFSNKIVANVGSMENRGVEFAINGDAVRKKDFTWNLGYNVTYNKNKITKLTISDDPNFKGNQFGGISIGTGTTLFINQVNQPSNSFYVYKQVYDATTGKPIDGLYEDLNRDGVLNDKDLYLYQKSAPDVFMGFTTGVTYKQWSAGTSLRASFGNYVYNNLNAAIGVRSNVFGTGYLNNAYRDLLNTNLSGTKNGQYLSDYYINNASFLRMDNVNLGYNAGRVFNDKANLRLGFNVNNVFVVTKYKGIDPEINGGVDNNFYPRPRTFIIGANLDF